MKAAELPQNTNCSIWRSLEVLGQKWTLLIVREAFWGRTRYAEFRRIGVPTDVLQARLASLVEEGILERHPYRRPGERTRDEYVLTPAGRDLVPILAALAEWGDEHRPNPRGPASVFVDGTTGRPVALAFTDAVGTPADPSDVKMVRGSGAMAPTP
ncbi:winged helix-turn-helix transcriptional regulator [Streptosporangium sp. NPDC002721]|uniref:winged helix-turn-helix transcriptional regulator n=1 Tax=Streptosporangium sp. NPDC002721 TaxID=3366188 RepID=UPI003680F519